MSDGICKGSVGSYFFDVRHGPHFYTDLEGLSEVDEEAAVKHAVNLIAEQVINQPSVPYGSLSIEVRRENDRVATVSLSIARWPGER